MIFLLFDTATTYCTSYLVYNLFKFKPNIIFSAEEGAVFIYTLPDTLHEKEVITMTTEQVIIIMISYSIMSY